MRAPRQPPSAVPIVILRRAKVVAVLPVQLQGHRAVAHVVADVVQIPRVYQDRNFVVEEIGDVGSEVRHPVRVAPASVDALVAIFPGNIRRHVEGVFRRVEVQERCYGSHILAERADAGFGDVVNRNILPLEGSEENFLATGRLLTEEFLAQSLGRAFAGVCVPRATLGGLLHLLVLVLVVDDLYIVGILERHVGVPLHLLLLVDEAVPDGHPRERQV
mmetsp:Transcript_15109/g.32986  ORF Transcript_15109/g.32986 Transcript_15109/m.32986 type:complete len:218 (+) Transcript_15109:192-845(+)